MKQLLLLSSSNQRIFFCVDRSSNNKYYTNAEQETQPQAGPRVSRGNYVLIENKPQINVTTNNNLQGMYCCIRSWNEV